MSDIHDFYRSIRETGAYATPPALGPRRPMRGGLAAALRFYVGALGGVVAQGTRTIRRNTFGVNTLGELAWRLMHAAECMGTEVSFEGFAAMRGIDQQPAVIVANHMSLVETMMLPAGVFGNGPMVIVAKRSLTRYPWFGRILEASRPILVNRRNPRQDLADVLEQGAQRLREGCSVLLFPQGTRLPVFDPQRFNSLGVKLAKRAGVPLIPVACKTDFAKPGRVLRDFGPIDPSRPIRFAAGPRLDSSLPQRDLQEACTRHIVACLTHWNMPVVSAAAAAPETA
ncbi:MAG: 1-acyl-sn-glycerol-3-phosphate acyltransferase [Lentisphaerae bacterium]|nr:1-acyl-sn-glycerol-3-phosphate acyltransferase [Lentisphaerota bacterium]